MRSGSFFTRPLFWGIEVRELLGFAGLHAFLALMYFVTLGLAAEQWQTDGILINHTLKFLLTAPFWWLFFRRLQHLPLYAKVLLHLPACVLYVATWLFLFYQVLDALDIGRLRGRGIWWDVYIPALIYFIQFGIFHAFQYWKVTLRQQEKEKTLLRLAHTAELNVMKAQIQPHFLFNTLNSISASLPATQETTRHLIAQLSDVFRFSMNVIDKEAIPLQQEIRFLENCLALERQRFGDRLSFSFEIDEGLQDYPLPPMLLQPLVENAVKHGIARSLAGGHIAVRVCRVEDGVLFRVSDTGKGINGTPVHELFSKGIGLENTRTRIMRLFNRELEVQTNAEGGLTVQFRLP